MEADKKHIEQTVNVKDVVKAALGAAIKAVIDSVKNHINCLYWMNGRRPPFDDPMEE